MATKQDKPAPKPPRKNMERLQAEWLRMLREKYPEYHWKPRD